MLILSMLFGAFQPPKPASGGPATLFWDLLQNNPQNRHPPSEGEGSAVSLSFADEAEEENCRSLAFARDDKGEGGQRGEGRLQSLRLGPRRLLPRQQVCFVSSVHNFHRDGANLWYL